MSFVREALPHHILVDLDPNQRRPDLRDLLKAILTAIPEDRDRLTALVAGDVASVDEGAPSEGCESRKGAGDETG